MTHGSAAQKRNPDQRQLASATASTTSEPEPPDQVDEPEQQPLELILARNLISIVSLAAFLVNVEGHVVAIAACMSCSPIFISTTSRA